MTGKINTETQALAIGIISALRKRGPVIDAIATRLPDDLARDYRNLVVRALAVTEASTWGEVAAIYDDYLTMTARYGVLPSNGKVN